MFWTMDDSDGLPEVTLCEAHALSATNYAMRLIGEKPFGSMAEAHAVMSASTAMAGFDLGLISSEDGACGQCEDEKRLEDLEHDCS